jgi:UDP-4-amino-4,6-dideoxy-N-acetyl-beta-L-altrosamine transaminase
MIPYGRQSINDDDITAVTQALRSDFLTTGPLVEQFEHQIETIVGAPSLVVSSGTAALHCAYAAIRIQPGDEIITPPITFIATQATAVLLGARVVFADIQHDTGNIDPKRVEAAITPRTKAVVAVDYAGHPADLDELREIADKHGIYLIEDAAHAIGSTYKHRPVGSIADITTFSFYPTKNLTTGEGGAVSSIHPELLNRARKFSRQGLVREVADFKLQTPGPWHQEVHEFGLNYRLTDIQCALGISQIKRLKDFKQRRRFIFSVYSRAFGSNENLQTPTERNYVDSNWHLYPLHVKKELRRSLFEYLKSQDIGVQVNYIPAYQHPVFSQYKVNPLDFPNSESFYDTQISLPMHAHLTDADLEKVITHVEKFLQTRA